jgi:hypothetical protein
MDWKKDVKTGVLAAALVAVAIAVLVWFFVGTREKYPTGTFICDSTGNTFSVVFDPRNAADDQYVTATAGRPVTCKLDGKRDAYLAEKDPTTGKWIKQVPPPPGEGEEQSN